MRQDKTPDIDFRDRHGQSPTVSPETVRRDIALSLILPGTDSRRKTTMLSTTSQNFRPPCRQQLDRLPQILYCFSLTTFINVLNPSPKCQLVQRYVVLSEKLYSN
uniref:Uncharacterized protein n=1 Tax=Oryza sativa subsp. japonica TaxID=39947 RepID=Q7G1S1_ORYSJ|nr:hypothetical protein LOC_Os10g39280 [Oryza sativa Japonica Group]